jgi:hypothetical protein
MVKFLFWNINRKSLGDVVARAAAEHNVDVLILAESPYGDPASLLAALNSKRTDFFFPQAPVPGSPLQIFTRFSGTYLRSAFDGGGLTIRALSLPARNPVILAAVHFPSKLHWDEDSQALECVTLSRELRKQEEVEGHCRTIVVGDFNMNPFEPGMVGAIGLHAMMTMRLAERGSRKVRGVEYPFFYNPMWGHFGDLFGTVPGTHYYRGSAQVAYFWNMFDQVLIRPGLTAGFIPDELQIVTEVDGTTLLRPDGTPRRDGLSDHLPIRFALDF